MQAIITKYFGVTNTKPARIKASAARGSKFFSVHSEKMIAFAGNSEANHICAAKELLESFVKKDGNESWNLRFQTGQLPSGDYVHVFNPVKTNLFG